MTEAPQDERLARLLACADARAPGLEANAAMDARRRALIAEHGEAIFYEIVIEPHAEWPAFVARHVPRLTEHMIAKGQPMLGTPFVVVALWSGETVAFISAPELFRAVAAIERLGDDALALRIDEWREGAGLPPRGRVRGPLALPPGN